MMLHISVLCFTISAVFLYAQAYQPLLPLSLPVQRTDFKKPDRNNNATVMQTPLGPQSTNLFELIYKGDSQKFNQFINESYHDMDPNESGVITAQELQDGFKVLNSPQNGTLEPEFKALLEQFQNNPEVMNDLAQENNQNFTLEQYRLMTARTMTVNFTLYHGICIAAAQRIDLCRLPLNETVDNQESLTSQEFANLTRGHVLAREQSKCQSGIAGIQNDFAFQKCLVGSPCHRIHECFGKLHPLDNKSLQLLIETNANIDKVMAPLVNEDGKNANSFGLNGSQKGALAGTGTASAVVFALLIGLAKEAVTKAFVPLIAKVFQSAATSAAAALAPLLTPTVGMILLGTVLAAALIVTFYGSFKMFVNMIVDLFSPSKANLLIMDKYDAYNGEWAPKCNWAVYLQQECADKNDLAENYWSVCSVGGQPYRNRECGAGKPKQWRFFFQQLCWAGNCRHMCLNSNTECGDDGYRYLNGTEFSQRPTIAINPFMFEPSFENKQYALLDERYVYNMQQCRDTCNAYTSEIVGVSGFSGCVGFVLSAPDPYLDTRPAYQTHQVCRLLGVVSEDSKDVDAVPELSAIAMKKPLDRLAADYPVKLNNANELFGYNVMVESDYPPLIIGMKN